MAVDLSVVTTVLTVYAVVVVSPGPNFALVTRMALGQNRRTTNGAMLAANPRHDLLSGFRAGLLVNFSNPKAIAFFVGLYAVAVPPGTSLSTLVVVLAAGFALEVGWYSLVAFGLSRPGIKAAYRRHTRTLDRLIGSLLIIFGVRLATSR